MPWSVRLDSASLSPEPLPEAAHGAYHPARQLTTSTDIQRGPAQGCADGQATPKGNPTRRRSNIHFSKSNPHDPVHLCQLFLLFLQVVFRLLKFVLQPLDILFGPSIVKSTVCSNRALSSLNAFGPRITTNNNHSPWTICLMGMAKRATVVQSAETRVGQMGRPLLRMEG